MYEYIDEGDLNEDFQRWQQQRRQQPTSASSYAGVNTKFNPMAQVASRSGLGDSAFSFDGSGNSGYQPVELGMNIPTFQLGLTGLGTLGDLWGTFQSSKLARDSFNFKKGMVEKNYANQIKSYNTALTDRATTRGFVQGDSTDTTQQYISDNKL